MVNGMYLSASGIMTAQWQQRVTANNIANLNTPGFRASSATASSQPGGGAVLGSITQSQAQGPLMPTGQPLDVATSSSGRAFFQVTLPDGNIAYTPTGRFGMDAEGFVVTSEGNRLEPPIQVPENTTGVQVGRDGMVYATVPGGVGPEPVGRIEVATFTNPDGMEALGNGLYRATQASGAPQIMGEGVSLEPGYLEMSNVNLLQEQVNSILNLRYTQANLKAFQQQDEILGELLRILA